MRWARRLPAVDVEVDCAGAVHHVIYRRGCLVVLDHDVIAEDTLRGLGGDEAPCLAVLRAWRDTTLDTVTTPETIRARMRSHGQVPAWVVSLPHALDAVRRLTLVVTAERSWGTGRSLAVGAYLERETQRLALPALERWVAASGEASLQTMSLSCNVFAPPGEPSIECWHRGGTRVVAAWLPASWWREVGASPPRPPVGCNREAVGVL